MNILSNLTCDPSLLLGEPIKLFTETDIVAIGNYRRIAADTATPVNRPIRLSEEASKGRRLCINGRAVLCIASAEGLMKKFLGGCVCYAR